jgi:hypothetical protein
LVTVRNTRWRLTALVVAILVTVVACSGGATEGSVEFEVHLVDGQAWTAAGSGVDDDLMCPAGRRQVVEYRDSQGTIAAEDILPRMMEAGDWEPGDPIIDFRIVVQFTCANGSGSFTVEEIPFEGRGSWLLTVGTGAYTGLEGEGPCHREFDENQATEDEEGPIPPLLLLCSGEVAFP